MVVDFGSLHGCDNFTIHQLFVVFEKTVHTSESNQKMEALAVETIHYGSNVV
jgi:hypothetical protein